MDRTVKLVLAAGCKPVPSGQRSSILRRSTINPLRVSSAPKITGESSATQTFWLTEECLPDKEPEEVSVPKADPVKYEGVQYKSIRTLCRKLGVDYGTYSSRRHRGLSFEEALEAPHRYNYVVSVNGQQHPSIRAACKAHGVSFNTVQDRRRRMGLSVEESILYQPSDTLGDLCHQHGVLRWTYWARRKRGWIHEEALGLSDPPKHDPKPRNLALLKHVYGFTLKGFETLVAENEGKCWICQEHADPPCVDHCHQTGKVRGILCRACNTGIGRLGDDPQRLRLAAQYLETHG